MSRPARRGARSVGGARRWPVIRVWVAGGGRRRAGRFGAGRRRTSGTSMARAPPPAAGSGSGSPVVSTRRPSAWRTSSSADSFAGAATDSNGSSPSSADQRVSPQQSLVEPVPERFADAEPVRHALDQQTVRRSSGRPSDRADRASSSNRLCASRPSCEPRPDRDDIGPVPGTGGPGRRRGPPSTARASEAARPRPTPRSSAESVVRAREEWLSGRVPTGWWEPVSYPNAQRSPATAERDPSARVVRRLRTAARSSPRLASPVPRSPRVRRSAVRRQTLGERAIVLAPKPASANFDVATFVVVAANRLSAEPDRPDRRWRPNLRWHPHRTRPVRGRRSRRRRNGGSSRWRHQRPAPTSGAARLHRGRRGR